MSFKSSAVRSWFLMLFLSFVLLACLPAFGQFKNTAARLKFSEQDWVISPGGTSGAITAKTTKADLVARYGATNVVDQEIALIEGETEPGTVLFAKDPQRKITILWKDPETKLSPKSLIVTGWTSHWRTVRGISMGMSLKELGSLNRSPFTLSGMGMDTGWGVTSWKNGVLSKELEGNGNVFLWLCYEKKRSVTKSEQDEVTGDQELSSNHPVLVKLNPQICHITWDLP